MIASQTNSPRRPRRTTQKSWGFPNRLCEEVEGKGDHGEREVNPDEHKLRVETKLGFSCRRRFSTSDPPIRGPQRSTCRPTREKREMMQMEEGMQDL